MAEAKIAGRERQRGRAVNRVSRLVDALATGPSRKILKREITAPTG